MAYGPPPLFFVIEALRAVFIEALRALLLLKPYGQQKNILRVAPAPLSLWPVEACGGPFLESWILGPPEAHSWILGFLDFGPIEGGLGFLDSWILGL